MNLYNVRAIDIKIRRMDVISASIFNATGVISLMDKINRINEQQISTIAYRTHDNAVRQRFCLICAGRSSKMPGNIQRSVSLNGYARGLRHLAGVNNANAK